MYQKPLPDEYTALTDADAVGLIRGCKDTLGDRLVVLGHHYQRDEIIQFADFCGDSLKLSQLAAEQDGADFIVFCGVHFMAESADILTADQQAVLLPDLTAGCSMADMAELDQVEDCWQLLTDRLPKPQDLVPVTYVNSSAAIKAFCGRHGGYCCTSSNCREIFEAITAANPQAVIVFFPDQHLARNTAYALGYPLEQMPLWRPFEADGGLADADVAAARVILWDGYCSVHQEFTVDDVARVRRDDPDAKIIVHPECCFDVVQQADLVGSTAYIVKEIEAAPAGSHWAVGTEKNLVERLGHDMAAKDVSVYSLGSCDCLCETMYRIDLPHLAWLMDALVQHARCPDEAPLENRIVVDEQTKQDARKALQRMLDVTAAAAK